MAAGPVLLFGIASESPLRKVADALHRRGVEYLVLSQRQFASTSIGYDVVDGCVGGVVATPEREVDLARVGGVYLRLMDETVLPEWRRADAALRERCTRWHQAVVHWCEIAPARVVNRLSAMASNASKPYQLQAIRAHGLASPETLITDDPARVRSFVAEHGRAICKSASGVRSIVRELVPADFERLERVRDCPTLFQALVDGTNVRVHVVGRRVFATEIDCDVVDYRYAQRESAVAHLRETQLLPALEQRCIALASTLGLPFAGIDLMLGRDGSTYCFEVNPSPGFSYFEDATGQPIADAVAEYLDQGAEP
jgi:hypothetical protein